MPGEIVPISIPGIHDYFWPFLLRQLGSDKSVRVLDAGAGHGAMSRRLHEAGYDVHACDFRPDIFYFQPVECRQANLNDSLPYADESFDAVVAVEVLEHLLDHDRFFSECHRVLKPGGKLIATTPNILSLKSRLRFLGTGFFYSFEPLRTEDDDGLQHVSGRTLNQYHYLARRNGMTIRSVEVDKYQSTSRALLALWPLLWVYSRIRHTQHSDHNRMKLLLGRIVFITFQRHGPVQARA
jgi:SAM-dependent methyltransferase